MTIRLPRYTTKDYFVLAIILLPYTLIINTLIFGSSYYTDWGRFGLATLGTAIFFAGYFTLCGSIAVRMKERFPAQSQTAQRLGFMILIFLITTGLALLLLFRVYESIPFFEAPFKDDNFIWAYFGLGIGNIFLTFLHEGIARYESWKVNQEENEQLRQNYRQGRLQGLKSQVNPHFLFNSLNCLSSLINENEEKAETFLNEMSKVYRYMLRNEEDPMVTLETEMKFIHSYIYLLTSRYGAGLQFTIDVKDGDHNKFLPPLSLQIIIENAITQNVVSKDRPLAIEIWSGDDDQVVITNNLQPRMQIELYDAEQGLDNLVNRYELLNRRRVVIRDGNKERKVFVPLLEKKEGEKG
jgi:sensor histidine kinase YesM